MRINSTRTGIWKHSTFYFGFKIKHMFHFTAWQSHKYDNQNKWPSAVVYTSLCCKYSLDLCEMEIIFQKQGRKYLRFNDIVIVIGYWWQSHWENTLHSLLHLLVPFISSFSFPCFKLCLHYCTKCLLDRSVSLLCTCKL